MAVLGLASVLSEPRRRWRWLLLCQGPLLALLFATGGRAALLGYAATLLFGVTLRTVRAGFVRAGLAIAGTLGGIVAVVLGVGWLAGDWAAAELGRGDTFRLEIWASNYARVMQRPWFGHGSTALDQFTINGTVVGYHAHNLFLAQAFYGGAIGLALWLAVFALAARAALLAWRASGDILPASGLCFLLMVGMVDIGYVVVDVQAIWCYVWLVLGIALSYDVAARARYAAGGRAPRRAATSD
jgi:O-antigen ligase